MIDKRQFLLDFYDSDYNRCAFKYKNGIHYEGYITEVDDTTFTFYAGGPAAPDEPYIFEISLIDETSFFYWNKQHNSWMSYPGQVKHTPTPVKRSAFQKVSDLLDRVLTAIGL